MKGKVAFALGAAVGYVFGTRAGRERYEQIKRGAETLWNTEPVQRGAGIVRDAVDARVGDVKDAAAGMGAKLFSSLAQRVQPTRQEPRTAKAEESSEAPKSDTAASPGTKSGAKSAAQSASKAKAPKSASSRSKTAGSTGAKRKSSAPARKSDQS